MSKKKILCYVLLTAILVNMFAAGEVSVAAEQQQPAYSNLVDAKSRKEVRSALLSAGISAKTADVWLKDVVSYNKTIKNTSLVKKGFYDGLIFHRVINGFMIQGGCPDGTGMGGPGYSIKGEFTQNRFKNDLKHTAGVLSMARAMHPNSAGSQFFIMHKDAPHLDGAYAAFGKITEGMDVVNRIAEEDTDYSDRPLDEQKIKSMTVETFGVDYPEPEKC